MNTERSILAIARFAAFSDHAGMLSDGFQESLFWIG